MATDLASATAEYRAAQQAVADAKAQVRASQTRLKTARDDLNASVVDAARSGTRMRDLADITGLSREWLRQLLRAAGVDPDWR